MSKQKRNDETQTQNPVVSSASRLGLRKHLKWRRITRSYR